MSIEAPSTLRRSANQYLHLSWFVLGIGCASHQARTDSANARTRTPLSLDSASRAALSSFPAGSPMASMAESFLHGQIPSAANLSDGIWIAVRTVRTQFFLTGGSGPDEVRFDSTGLHDDTPSRPYFYVIGFRQQSPGKLRVTQQFDGDAMTANSVAAFASIGTVAFSEDIDADEQITLNCRALGSSRLVCLDLEHLGDGIEFRRRAAR